VEVTVVVEAGQRVGLRLELELGADLRVVERERRRVREARCELELLVGEARVFAEPVDVQHALDHVAGDQGHGDQRLGLVVRRARHRLRARVEVGLVGAHRLAVKRCPAGDALAEVGAAVHDLLGPLVAGEHGDEDGLCLVGLVDRERVVRDELGERVRDPLEQVVEAVLRENVVEDVGQLPVRLDEGLRARGFGDGRITVQREHGWHCRKEMPHTSSFIVSGPPEIPRKGEPGRVADRVDFGRQSPPTWSNSRLSSFTCGSTASAGRIGSQRLNMR